MLTSNSLAAFAALEYKRDPDFRKFVDGEVAALVTAGRVVMGTGLEEILCTAGADGLPLAKIWLNAFHEKSSLPQWQRARDLERERY